MVTRFAFREIALTYSEHGAQYFPADHPAFLPEGDTPLGERISLRFRRHRRGPLDERLRYATQPEVAYDRFLLAYLSRFHATHLLVKLMKDLRSPPIAPRFENARALPMLRISQEESRPILPILLFVNDYQPFLAILL